MAVEKQESVQRPLGLGFDIQPVGTIDVLARQIVQPVRDWDLPVLLSWRVKAEKRQESPDAKITLDNGVIYSRILNKPSGEVRDLLANILKS